MEITTFDPGLKTSAMKKSLFFLLIVMSCTLQGLCQSNITLSNPEAEQILLGNYNPANYTPAVITGLAYHDPPEST